MTETMVIDSLPCPLDQLSINTAPFRINGYDDDGDYLSSSPSLPEAKFLIKKLIVKEAKV